MKHATTVAVRGPPTSAEQQLPPDPTGLWIKFQMHKVSFKEMRGASHKHPLLSTPTDLWLAKTLHDTDCASVLSGFPIYPSGAMLLNSQPSLLSGMVSLFINISKKLIKLSCFFAHTNMHFDLGTSVESHQKSGLQGCYRSSVGVGQGT